MLETASRNNIKLNKEKFKIAQTHIKYMGHIMSGEGVHVDTDKITAITKMPRPENKEGVQRILGILN